ncbi:glucosidase family protein [Marinitenerispora sediminis]|uniref:Prenyltransferase n=1 Tax=Marinitenerispora sediminis TaxID=1931232 RepID=A0A368T8C2_9ACTN|nr:prenyltransferase [Marinitenerispora sediminis]RCV51130.1 prenyltransferase [Marinitenerispora sediminis]RCV58346.1 prenyltransferase [Marinitenerispora sediminis]RCV60149.1 prenyltransferase [Marinitenerispora sediminis]
MSGAELPHVPGVLSGDDVARSAEYLLACQEGSGAIPWFPGGHVDAWDHVECAMALSATGHTAAAARAYDWLAAVQRPDGAWPAKIRQGRAASGLREANHAGYLAVGVWHHVLVTGDAGFAERLWPAVRAAVGFVLGLRTERGEIQWARGPDGRPGDHALLTGCASLHQALRCAAALAEWLGRPQPDWELAAAQLGHLVADHESIFADRGRFSMDWYYPILGGAVRGTRAAERLSERWETFVVPGLGIRCVSDQPWVTGAETSELVLALAATGDVERGIRLLADIQHLRDADDGAYWTGYQFAEDVNWPVERSTWTAAAVILAADALSGATGGARVFTDAPADVAPADPVSCGCAVLGRV